MLNFILYDLKKTFWGRQVLLCCVILLLICLLDGAVMFYNLRLNYDSYIQQLKKPEQSSEQAADQTEVKVETSTDLPRHPDGSAFTADEFHDYQEEQRQSVTLKNSMDSFFSLIVVIFAISFSLHVSNDFSSGYLKNMLSIRSARKKWLGSKIALSLVLYSLYFILVLFVSLGIVHVVQGGLPATEYGYQLKLFCLGALYILIFAMLILFVLLYTQNKVAAIVFAILTAMGLPVSLVQLLDGLLKTHLKTYLYSQQLLHFQIYPESSLTTLLIIGAVSLLVPYLMNRRRISHMDFVFPQ